MVDITLVQGVYKATFHHWGAPSYRKMTHQCINILLRFGGRLKRIDNDSCHCFCSFNIKQI